MDSWQLADLPIRQRAKEGGEKMRAAIFLVVVWLATILVTVGGIAVLNQVVDLGIRWAIALPIAEAVAGLAVCLLAGVFSTPVARQSTARKGR